MCIENQVIATGCRWTGVPSGCKETCARGEILITQNSWIGGQQTGCQSGHYSSFCCEEITAPETSLNSCGHFSGDLAFGGGFGFRKRGSMLFDSTIYGTDLECASYLNVMNDPIPYYEDPTPGFFPVDAGPIILNTQPGYWISAINSNDLIWEPLENQPYPDEDPDPVCTSTTTSTVETTSNTDTPVTITCSGNRFPQACMHYSSVIREYNHAIDTVLCKASRIYITRGAVAEWNTQHDEDWNYWIKAFPKRNNGKPERCNR